MGLRHAYIVFYKNYKEDSSDKFLQQENKKFVSSLEDIQDKEIKRNDNLKQ